MSTKDILKKIGFLDPLPIPCPHASSFTNPPPMRPVFIVLLQIPPSFILRIYNKFLVNTTCLYFFIFKGFIRLFIVSRHILWWKKISETSLETKNLQIRIKIPRFNYWVLYWLCVTIWSIAIPETGIFMPLFFWYFYILAPYFIYIQIIYFRNLHTILIHIVKFQL